MRTHYANRSDPARTRCGRKVTDTTRIDTDPDTITCQRCTKVDDQLTLDPPGRRIGLLRYELEASLADAAWLTGADRAAVQLARHLADALDGGALDADETVRTARQLTQLYRELRLTPDGRPAQPEATQPASPLTELRASSTLRAVDG